MKNIEIAEKLSSLYFNDAPMTVCEILLKMAECKDNQPIIESGGWHTGKPTENGWYLVDTPNFPKNCRCVVAEWDNNEENFFDEFDCPIKVNKWKLIERW